LALRAALLGLVALDVVLVAIARIALAEHYPTDILGGFLGGIGALAVYALLTRPGGWAHQTGADSDEARTSRQRSEVTSPRARSAEDLAGGAAARRIRRRSSRPTSTLLATPSRRANPNPMPRPVPWARSTRSIRSFRERLHILRAGLRR
jgi:hypothetical protein